MTQLMAIALSSALAGIAIWKKALTPLGIVLAWLMCLAICVIGGIPAFLILAATFLLTVSADKFAGQRADPHGLRRKSGRRDAVRVLCNVGVGTAMIRVYGLTHKTCFLYAYAAVMAESLSDSLASKLGPLTQGKTVDICTFRETSVGLSGGVSTAGSIAAIFGAVLIGALSLLFPDVDVKAAFLITVIGYAGCVFDSVIGSVAQVKYRCPVCGRVVERDSHCGAPTAPYKGLRPINNDAVNLLSNLFSAILAILIL